MLLEEFTETHGLILKVNLRAGNPLGVNRRYYASIHGCHVHHDYSGSNLGDGHTGDAALNDLATQLSGTTIVANSTTNGQLTLEVPMLDHIKNWVCRGD